MATVDIVDPLFMIQVYSRVWCVYELHTVHGLNKRWLQRGIEVKLLGPPTDWHKAALKLTESYYKSPIALPQSPFPLVVSRDSLSQVTTLLTWGEAHRPA